MESQASHHRAMLFTERSSAGPTGQLNELIGPSSVQLPPLKTRWSGVTWSVGTVCVYCRAREGATISPPTGSWPGFQNPTM